MGISFKVSKVGSRFRPKHFQSENILDKDGGDNSISEEISKVVAVNESPFTIRKTEVYAIPVADNVAGNSGSGGSSISSGGENEVSFTLNLFQDGYCIKKPSEVDALFHSPTEDGLVLRPYDRNSESLFSAIEAGRLPRDMFDDIECKYIDGGIICEVHDYRKIMSKPGCTPVDVHPIVNKVMLKMSLENILKDIPSISDNSWTYGDLMEVESRILKALQPKLYLEPTPILELLSTDSKSEKLNLGIQGRRKRSRCISDVTVTSSNMINGKKVCIDRVYLSKSVEENVPVTGSIESNVLLMREKQSGEDATISTFQPHQLKLQSGVVNLAPELVGNELVGNYNVNMSSTASLIHGKMGILDGDLTPPSSFNKKVTPISTGPDILPPRNQYTDPQLGGFNESEWKHPILQQQQIGRGFQQANPCLQKLSSYQVLDGRPSQEHGVAFSGGQHRMRELIDVDKLDLPEINMRKNNFNVMDTNVNRLDSQQERFLLQRSQQQQQQQQQMFMSSGFSPTPWNFPSQQHSEKDIKKEDQFPKRKLIQSPRVSSGALVQSPLSSKSGELSSGSLGPHFGAAAIASTLLSQKEKAPVSSVSVAGTPSLTSSANDSLQRQQQAHLAKRRSNSLPRTPSAGRVGSPASVGNINIPINVSSPSCGGVQHSGDQNVLERFAKIESTTKRFQLNRKKNKVTSHHPRNPTTFCGVQIAQCMSAINNSDDGKDDADIKSLEKSVIGGSVNAAKMRILNLMQPDRILQGNVVSMKIQNRMIMIEKPSDGTIAMHYGDAEIGDVLSIEDSLPTLPNAHLADLLADQFHSLMVREGHMIEDYIQQKPTHMNLSSYSQANDSEPFTRPSASDSSHYSGHPSNIPASANTSLTQSHSISPGIRTLSSVNHPPFHMGQGLMPDASMATNHTSLLDQQPSHHILKNQPSMVQQQHSQLPRSPLMLMNNPLPSMTTIGQTPNLPLGGQLMNKPSHFQFPMLQQQQQQQQPQMQRKLMMGAGMGSSLIGVRGMGTGMSAPVIPMNAVMGAAAAAIGGNTMNMNQGSISHQVRSGHLTQAQAALMVSRMRFAQSRGIVPGNCQANLQAMAGVRPLNPGSSGLPMSNINRGNMNYMSRATLGNMGPPKLMTGTNMYMNQQQQQQQLQLHQYQQQLQQHQQLQMQQQHQLMQNETTSPSLHSVVTSSQVGSPSAMVMPQQHPSPHQRTPLSPKMSGGGTHPGNTEGLPSSPQLSSPNLGSVGSITNPSLDLQGVNMTNSISNTNV